LLRQTALDIAQYFRAIVAMGGKISFHFPQIIIKPPISVVLGIK
jgi:hypothetical protein